MVAEVLNTPPAQAPGVLVGGRCLQLASCIPIYCVLDATTRDTAQVSSIVGPEPYKSSTKTTRSHATKLFRVSQFVTFGWVRSEPDAPGRFNTTLFQ
jgi:hypothetical protein